MLRLLEEIRERTPDEHPFLGDRELLRLNRELALLPPHARDADRFRLRCQLGFHELRLGRIESSLEHLRAAHEMLPAVRSEIPRDVAEASILQLAVAYLRMAETSNCVHCQTGESCILPIRGGGVHADRTGSEKAMEHLASLLEWNPEHLTARWLMNLAAMTLGRYPAGVPERHRIRPEAFISEDEFPRFVNVAAALGLNTVDLCGGTVIDDFDNDGLLDVVTSTWDTAGQLRFFRNNGDGTFSDRTRDAGLIGIYGGLNLVQADYDNDGNVDLLVLRGAWLGEDGRHPNSLLRNEGGGRFRDVTFEAGLGNAHFPTSTAGWADYNHNGHLDLYVGNEGYPCQLFENNGNGTFTDVTRRAGVENGRFTKGVSWGDFNGDRLPDLYVSNLDGPNRLYRNDGDGSFTDVAAEVGVERPLHSFACWFWDFNNDGALDLFVASYSATAHHVAADYLGLPHGNEPDCLYQGDGKGGFRDVAAEQNLNRVTQPMGSNFGDLDNDGYPDIYLGTGDTAYEALMPNLVFWNRGGRGFSDVTMASGMGHLQKGHGVAFADLDNDGDQDVFIQLGGAFAGDAFGNALFENPGFGNNWITVKLVGTRSNRSAIGARIRVDIKEPDGERSIYAWVNSGGSFGANPLRQEIGLGKADVIDRLEVFWPTTGRTQRFRDVAVNQFLEIREEDEEFRRLPSRSFSFRR